MCQLFPRLDKKHKLFGNFEKILKILATFEKVVAKNRAFGNNIIFLQHFSISGGGGTFPVFPPTDIIPTISNKNN